MRYIYKRRNSCFRFRAHYTRERVAIHLFPRLLYIYIYIYELIIRESSRIPYLTAGLYGSFFSRAGDSIKLQNSPPQPLYSLSFPFLVHPIREFSSIFKGVGKFLSQFFFSSLYCETLFWRADVLFGKLATSVRRALIDNIYIRLWVLVFRNIYKTKNRSTSIKSTMEKYRKKVVYSFASQVVSVDQIGWTLEKESKEEEKKKIGIEEALSFSCWPRWRKARQLNSFAALALREQGKKKCIQQLVITS